MCETIDIAPKYPPYLKSQQQLQRSTSYRWYETCLLSGSGFRAGSQSLKYKSRARCKKHSQYKKAKLQPNILVDSTTKNCCITKWNFWSFLPQNFTFPNSWYLWAFEEYEQTQNWKATQNLNSLWSFVDSYLIATFLKSLNFSSSEFGKGNWLYTMWKLPTAKKTTNVCIICLSFFPYDLFPQTLEANHPLQIELMLRVKWSNCHPTSLSSMA
jgi:hypothetical protein